MMSGAMTLLGCLKTRLLSSKNTQNIIKKNIAIETRKMLFKKKQSKNKKMIAIRK